MAIKVTVGEQKTQEKPFPKFVALGLGVGGLFLAISEKQILCIDKGGSVWEDGQYCEGHMEYRFDDDNFYDYNEPITLQNQ